MTIDQKWIEETFSDLAEISPLNHGGQKWVFRAKHKQDGDVVLKVVKPGGEPERVRREIVAAQRVVHPRVPVILEVGTCQSNLGECVWIREQMISGECLRPILTRGPLAATEVLRLGLQLLETLLATANENLVHRDVKPDNIIKDAESAFWLIDFGLARHLDLESVTADQAPFGVGTVGYSAPEQMRNRKGEIDGRADLFAVAITMYEAATGVNPFRIGASSALDVLQRSETVPLPVLRLSLTNGSAHSLADLIASMAQKRRDQRPRTVLEALEWMREICAAEGVL
ncbi:MAG: serine/threonine-protein kinase [Phycisphaerales bacterium]